MTRYLRIDGTTTNQDDPERHMWYSAGCGYWTDDWSKVVNRPGIPTCPHCGCPGFSTTMNDWLQVPLEFLKSHPRYDEWLPESKEICGREIGKNFMEQYSDWLKNV